MVDLKQKASLQRLMIVSALIIASVGVILGIALGRYQVIKAIGVTPAQIEVLRQKANDHDAEVNACMDRLNTSMLERDVALSSTEEMKKRVNLREQDIADQQDLIANYRKVISARGGLDLNVQKLVINALPERAYEYEIDLSYVNNGLHITGQVSIKLLGGGMEMAVPMPKTNFNFDYLERLKGQWTMPSGFTPEYVEIQLTQGGVITTQRYAWQVGAVIPNMPATLLEWQEANMLKSEMQQPDMIGAAKHQLQAKKAVDKQATNAVESDTQLAISPQKEKGKTIDKVVDKDHPVKDTGKSTHKVTDKSTKEKKTAESSGSKSQHKVDKTGDSAPKEEAKPAVKPKSVSKPSVEAADATTLDKKVD